MTIYTVKRVVKLQDIDAAGIVYFPRFLEYCHDAYFELLMAEGIDLPKSIQGGEYILPLVHAEADFKVPLRFGDEIAVCVEGAIKKKSSYTVLYSVHLVDDFRTLCCTAKTVHAAINRITFKPLKQVPDEILKALKMD